VRFVYTSKKLDTVKAAAACCKNV